MLNTFEDLTGLQGPVVDQLDHPLVKPRGIGQLKPSVAADPLSRLSAAARVNLRGCWLRAETHGGGGKVVLRHGT